MPYDFYEDENGNVYGCNHSMGLRTSRPTMRDKDSAFLNNVLNNLDGESHYGIEIISDLQRKYGTSKLQLGLLNGIFNYRDKMLAELKSRQEKLDNMVSANEQLIARLKQAEAQLEQYKAQGQPYVVNHCNPEVIQKQFEEKRVTNIQENETNNRILELYINGYSMRKISEMLHVTYNRVSSIVKQYRAING